MAMQKITLYVHEEVNNAIRDILSKPEEKLADWLWDHNVEVTNIIHEEATAEDEERAIHFNC